MIEDISISDDLDHEGDQWEAMTEDNIYVNEDCYLTTENIFNLHDYLYEGYVRKDIFFFFFNFVTSSINGKETRRK